MTMEDYPQQNAETDESIEKQAPPKAPPPIIGESESGETNSAPTTEESPDVAVGGTALFGRELLRRRQEVKLRREVARLKKRAQDLQTEQQTVSRQQQEFSKRLEEQEAFQKLKNVTMPRQESSRQKLHGRLESRPQTNTEELDRAIAQAELLASPNVQAEDVLHTVEAAAEQNLPIESAYERRHERKGEEGGNVDSEPIASNQGYYNGQLQPAAAADYQETHEQMADRGGEGGTTEYTTEWSPAGSGLYKRAIRSGFWTAIATVAFIALILIFR